MSTTAAPEPRATPEQQRALREDVANVLATREQIIAQTRNTFDPTRGLGIVCAANGSEQYLPYTVPTLMAQIARAGRRADIIIGLNDGYECPDVIAALAAMPDVEVQHLYTGDKPAGNIPSPIFERPDQPDAGYRIAQESAHQRIFVLHQRRGPYAAGKTRMLHDICAAMVMGSITRGWVPPDTVVLFDHETLLLPERPEDDLQPDLDHVAGLLRQVGTPQGVVQRLIAEYSSPTRPRVAARDLPAPPITLDSPGLEVLFGELERSGADIVSTPWRNCVYDNHTTYAGLPVLMPNLAAPVPVLHRAGYAAIGLTPHTRNLSAGCTVGRTAPLLGVYISMCTTYPGLVGEDATSTVLAHHAGFSMVLQRGLFNTNRCPALHELSPASGLPAWKEQYVRWVAVIDALEQLYGYDQIAPIRGVDQQMSMAIALALFAQTLRRTNDLAQSFELLQQIQGTQAELEDIRQRAKAMGYTMKSHHAFVTW